MKKMFFFKSYQFTSFFRLARLSPSVKMKSFTSIIEKLKKSLSKLRLQHSIAHVYSIIHMKTRPSKFEKSLNVI